MAENQALQAKLEANSRHAAWVAKEEANDSVNYVSHWNDEVTGNNYNATYAVREHSGDRVYYTWSCTLNDQKDIISVSGPSYKGCS